MLIHCWKELSIDFVTGLLFSTNWKSESFDSILVIIEWLTKMVHYELVTVTINASGPAKVIIDVVVCHHDLPDLIITNQGSVFTSKF